MGISFWQRVLGREETAQPLLPPPFQFVAKLGSGGEGEAWCARDPWLDRLVVCKRLLNPADTGSRTLNKMQRSKALRAMSLASGNGAPVLYGLQQYRGSDWLVCEYIEGVSLESLAEKVGRPLGPGQVIKMLVSVARALERLHRANLIHGDIAPGNILVTPMGTVHLVDFGLARQVGEVIDNAGVDGFRAPERAGSCRADESIDVYSLGALMLWLLGHPLPAQVSDANGRIAVSHEAAVAEADFPARRGKSIEAVTRNIASSTEEKLVSLAWQLTQTVPGNRSSVANLVIALKSLQQVVPMYGELSLAELAAVTDDPPTSREQKDWHDSEPVTKSIKSSSTASSQTGLSAVVPEVQAEITKGTPSAGDFSYGWLSITKDTAYSMSPLFRSMFVISMALIVGGLVWVGLGKDKYELSGLQATVDMGTIGATTILPREFDEAWLLSELNVSAANASASNPLLGHRLHLRLSCVEEFCEILAEHGGPVATHWHHQALIDSGSIDVWQGALKSLAIAAAAH